MLPQPHEFSLSPSLFYFIFLLGEERGRVEWENDYCSAEPSTVLNHNKEHKNHEWKGEAELGKKQEWDWENKFLVLLLFLITLFYF